MTSTNSIIIRAGQGTLSFLSSTETKSFRPYSVKSGMSLAANLREAFRAEPLLASKYDKATLLVFSPSLLIPTAEYNADMDIDALYGDTITGHKGEEKIVTEIPEFDVMNIFPVNSDLKMVVRDHFDVVATENVMTLVWKYLYKTYYQLGGHRRLFVYFHDKQMDVCSFEQHRICFANSFNAQHAHDALYFILYVWKQLGLSQQDDEIFILGQAPHQEWLTNRLQAYINKVHTIDNTASDNSARQAQDKKMPFDLTLCE